MNYVNLSWNDIEGYCNDLAIKIKATKFQPDMIIALGRGGMIPARLMSDILGVQNVCMFGIKLYTGVSTKKDKPTIEPFNHIIEKKNVLLIDDILDSGITIEKAYETLYNKKPKSIKIATLLCKKTSLKKPTFFSKECLENEWIIFPWEICEFPQVNYLVIQQ